MGNTCVICGAVIPEGRQMCPKCEQDVKEITQFAQEYMSDEVHKVAKMFRRRRKSHDGKTAEREAK